MIALPYMLDIAFIRNNPELVAANNTRRGVDVDIDTLLELDTKRRSLITKVESKRAEQNQKSDLIPIESNSDKKQALIVEMKDLKVEIQELESKLEPIQEQFNELMMKLPNIAHEDVPEGKDEEDNVVVKTWGKKPEFDFLPKDHVELMTDLGMVDFKRGTKVHGFRGYFLKNDGAKLSWAIWRYAQDFFLAKDFNPFIPPAIVKKEWLYGTGHLPGDGDDIYWTQDEDALAGTSEVPMMAYYADEILDETDLPFKALAFSPCYRREAGSHGRDTKGLIRVHEFYKLEQLVICKNSAEESAQWHEALTSNHEEFIETLGIPYQRL